MIFRMFWVLLFFAFHSSVSAFDYIGVNFGETDYDADYISTFDKPTGYEIYFGDKHFATILREFSWFKKRFTLDVPGPNDYTIRGDFWNYEYEFERKNRIVANVSRKNSVAMSQRSAAASKSTSMRRKGPFCTRGCRSTSACKGNCALAPSARRVSTSGVSK